MANCPNVYPRRLQQFTLSPGDYECLISMYLSPLELSNLRAKKMTSALSEFCFVLFFNMWPRTLLHIIYFPFFQVAVHGLYSFFNSMLIFFFLFEKAISFKEFSDLLQHLSIPLI